MNKGEINRFSDTDNCSPVNFDPEIIEPTEPFDNLSSYSPHIYEGKDNLEMDCVVVKSFKLTLTSGKLADILEYFDFFDTPSIVKANFFSSNIINLVQNLDSPLIIINYLENGPNAGYINTLMRECIVAMSKVISWDSLQKDIFDGEEISMFKEYMKYYKNKANNEQIVFVSIEQMKNHIEFCCKSILEIIEKELLSNSN